MSKVRMLGSFEVCAWEHNLVGELEFDSIEYFVTNMIDFTKGNQETFAYLKDTLMKNWPNDQPAGDLKMMLKLIESTEELHNSIFLQPIPHEKE